MDGENRGGVGPHRHKGRLAEGYLAAEAADDLKSQHDDNADGEKIDKADQIVGPEQGEEVEKEEGRE